MVRPDAYDRHRSGELLWSLSGLSKDDLEVPAHKKPRDLYFRVQQQFPQPIEWTYKRLTKWTLTNKTGRRKTNPQALVQLSE